VFPEGGFQPEDEIDLLIEQEIWRLRVSWSSAPLVVVGMLICLSPPVKINLIMSL
jgi:hypothetical protein